MSNDTTNHTQIFTFTKEKYENVIIEFCTKHKGYHPVAIAKASLNALEGDDDSSKFNTFGMITGYGLSKEGFSEWFSALVETNGVDRVIEMIIGILKGIISQVEEEEKNKVEIYTG